MNKSKMKVIVLCLAIVMIMSLTIACTTQDSSSSAETSSATSSSAESASTAQESASSGKPSTVNFGEYEINVPDKDPSALEIAIVYMDVTNPFGQLIKQGVDAAAEELGCNAYMTGPTAFSTEEQARVIEDLITKKVDGMSIAVVDIPGLTPYIQKSLQAGIPTTCFNVDAPDSGRLAFAGQDLFKSGQETGRQLAKLIIEKYGADTNGTILVSTISAESEWSILRENGARDILSKELPNVTITTNNVPGDEQTEYAGIESAYTATPDLIGVISTGGGNNILWGNLLKEKNRNVNSDNPIYVVGHDVYENGLEQIIDGWASVALSQNPYDQGYYAVKTLYDFLTTGDTNEMVSKDTGILVVDQSNAAETLQELIDGKPIG